MKQDTKTIIIGVLATILVLSIVLLLLYLIMGGKEESTRRNQVNLMEINTNNKETEIKQDNDETNDKTTNEKTNETNSIILYLLFFINIFL